ncbi:MFS transporter [Archangium gephyra]|nr:MFS transporter [Archangium gephyra]
MPVSQEVVDAPSRWIVRTRGLVVNGCCTSAPCLEPPILATLKHRDFALLWGSQVISGLGDWLRNMALLYWVFSITGGESPVATAAIAVITMAPALLLGLTAGTLADRWERRRVLISCDAIRGGLSLLMLLAVATSNLPLAYGVAFCSSVVEQLYDPARAALIRAVVPREELMAASSLRQTTTSAIAMLGMAVGTSIYFLLGPWWSFVLDSASFFASMLCGLALKTRSVGTSSSALSSVWRGAKEGLSHVRGSPFVRSLLVLGGMAMLASGLLEVVQIYLVTQQLGLPEDRLAWLGTALGVSMFAGFALVGVFHQRFEPRWLPGLGIGVAGVGVGVMAVAPSLWVAIAGTVLVGLGNVLLSVGLGPLVQTYVERDFLGRVMGIFRSVNTGCMLLGAGVAGSLIAIVDTRLVIGSSGVLLVVAAIVTGSRLAREVVALEGAKEDSQPAPVLAAAAASSSQGNASP